MRGPALPLSLLLCIAVLRTRGDVTAPSSLTAEAGFPFLLSCNITTATGDTVRQVRWRDRHGQSLLAYEPGAPVRISHQETGVRLTGHHDNGSYVTVLRARPDDEGCFRCVFDVFPVGSQEGRTCVKVTGKVRLAGNKTATSGKPVTLSCRYSLPERVHQVLWRKTAEQGDTTTVAAYSKQGHDGVEEPFKGLVSLSRTLDDTRLTIQQVRTEDEACYTCEFHTYPDGSKSATACLSVYGLTSVIQTVETVEEAVGEDALLSCQLLQSGHVVQVIWQKQTADGETNVATISEYFGSRVISGFRGKVELKGGGLHKSSIVIKNVTEEDEGCFLCLFITNPDGALTGRTSLRVYELHEPVLNVSGSKSTDESLVSCSTTGRPAPTVTLHVTQQGFYLSRHNTVSVLNTDGTVTVTATAVLAGFHDNGTQVGCTVQVLSGRKQAFVVIPADGLDQGSESASRRIIRMWTVGVSFLLTASVAAVLFIRKQRSRDLETTEVPQTADADTVQVALFTPERSLLRERTSAVKSQQK